MTGQPAEERTEQQYQLRVVAYTVVITTAVATAASWIGDWTYSTNVLILVMLLGAVQPLKIFFGN